MKSTKLPPEPRDESPDESAIDRRRFIHVLAAGSAAIIAGSLPRAAVAAAKAPPPKSMRAAAKPLPPSMEKELRNQEKGVADALKVIRAYDLPPGSEPATVFRAMRARRGGR